MSHTTPRPPFRRFHLRWKLLVLLLLTSVAVALWANPPLFIEADGSGCSVVEPTAWQRIDSLINHQQFQAALEQAEAVLEKARGAGDAEAEARALITATQLRIGLHGYETAVRELRQAPWPDEPVAQVALRLFYAQSLVIYYQGYSWEIDQRERVDTGAEIDLKAWTQEQIYDEAQRVYGEIWEGRERWGAEPVGRLAPYLQQNNYPARIRGTLRDTVTYLWVELLADTGFWSAEESNGVYRLDRDTLLADAGPVTDLEEGDPHPLLKLTRLLGDLEAWHLDHDRPEAAFEARLERLRRLGASLTQEDDGEALRADLRQHLDALGSRYEWWSVGMSQLAEMVRGMADTPEFQALVEARKIALQGVERHPDSIGGQRCRHLVESIEAPDFHMMSMLADGAGKRSLRVQHRNLAGLHFRAYRFDLEGRVQSAKDFNLLPNYRDVQETFRRTTPVARWQLDLPPTPDYRDHETYVTPPMTEPGAYVIIASIRSSFAEQNNRQSAVNFLLTDLVLLRRSQPEAGIAEEAVVRSGSTGETVPGAAVTLYHFDWQNGHRAVRTTRTDRDGIVRFSTEDQEDRNRSGRYFLLARKGEDLALDAGYLQLWERGESREQHATLIYTDRSIYRPGQTLHWKVAAYHGDAEAGRYQVDTGRTLNVYLRDANGEQVAEAAVRTNEYGTASGSFTLPASGRLLGAWSLNASYNGSTTVRVEEYKRPTFEVSLQDPEGALRLNRPARFTGEARYYFGLPVPEGEARWRVTREPVYPHWWGWYSWWFVPSATPEIVAAGESPLNADGGFDLNFTPEADERLAEKGTTYRYRVEVDVTDEGGETRSASRAFRLGFVAVEASFPDPAGFYTPDAPASLTVQRADLDGLPRAGDAHWQLFRLKEPEATLTPAEQPLPAALLEEGLYRTEGDRQRPRWAPQYDPQAVLREWPTGEEMARGDLHHGEDGKATLTLGELAPGAYRIRYTTKDAFGAEYRTQRELVVSEDRAAALPLPALLAVERGTVPVGQTARLLVSSGLAQQELVLETYRGGRRIGRQVYPASREPGARLLEIPIEPEHRGGFGLTLTALRDHQLMSLEERVFVPWDDRRLNIELATFRDRLRPGQKERWRLVVRGEEGALEAGAAELLAYMYDKSLDLFAPHSPPDILQLYPRRTSVVQAMATLSASHEMWRSEQGLQVSTSYPPLHGDFLKMLGGYGIGGMGRRSFRGGMAKTETIAMADGRVPAPAAAMEEMEANQALAADMAPGEPEPQAPPPPPSPPGGEDGAVEVRSNFAETAFWEPHLVVGEDGAAVLEFTVPDSVTQWSFWTHAITPDLRGGSHQAETRSVKELLVRPYLPRFLREGDQAELRVVVNNAGEESFSGALDFQILDADTEEPLGDAFGLAPTATRGVPFTVEPGGGTTLRFPITVPSRVGLLAFRVTARAGDFSDGELRPLPVLPGRMHLMQSRFAVVKDAGQRTLRFADLAADDDPTRIDEQLVVTLDAQLFYGVLNALPYLVDYPYECTEQTLNRFLSTGIVTSVFDRYPAVAAMAQKMAAERDTRLETWDAADPNRKMALEETPWLRLARGGGEEDLLKVLDPEIAETQRRSALAKLQQSQTSLGGFPWMPGGPPSPYMTLYLLYGFSKALEFDVEVPQPMVRRAWSYMHRHYLDELVERALQDDCCVEFVTFLNFVLSSYPEQDANAWTGGVFTAEDRQRMLDFSFRHWKKVSPLVKGYLTLTLERAGRHEDAVLVFDSVMDSAKTEEDLGTYWAPEDRAWLWYNDTIESHALALRVLAELDPDDPRRDGLVQWLFLNKHLNHWKSTRATAEVIYSLVHYLDTEGTLGAREEARVRIADQRWEFTFEPDEYTGKDNHIVLTGDENIGPETAEIQVSKDTPGYLFASATWHFSTEKLPEEARGDFFGVTRRYFKRVQQGEEWVLQPLADGARLEVGDQVEVQLSLTAKHAAEYVHLRDPRGAGFEPETLTSGYKWNLGLGWYEEIRDSGTNFFFDWLPVGEYTFKYRLRAATAGTFKVAPATVQPMYAPEFSAYSSGARIGIAGE